MKQKSVPNPTQNQTYPYRNQKPTQTQKTQNLDYNLSSHFLSNQSQKLSIVHNNQKKPTNASSFKHKTQVSTRARWYLYNTENAEAAEMLKTQTLWVVFLCIKVVLIRLFLTTQTHLGRERKAERERKVGGKGKTFPFLSLSLSPSFMVALGQKGEPTKLPTLLSIPIFHSTGK
jgi:hypothetical protein